MKPEPPITVAVRAIFVLPSITFRRGLGCHADTVRTPGRRYTPARSPRQREKPLTLRGGSPISRPSEAQVAELVDAQVSGTCGRKVVEVRVFSWAPWLRREPSYQMESRDVARNARIAAPFDRRCSGPEA